MTPLEFYRGGAFERYKYEMGIARPGKAAKARRLVRSLCPLVVFVALAGWGALADGPSTDGLEAFKAGRYEDALEAFRRDAASRPDDPEAAANVGAALARLGRNEDAVTALEGALERSPTPRAEAAIRYDLATARLALGDLDAAIDDLVASLRLVPDDLQAKRNLEIALARRARRPPPPPGGGAPPSPNGAGAPPPPAGGSGNAQTDPGAPRPMTREEAERLLDALGRRERLDLPRVSRRPASDPGAPDW